LIKYGDLGITHELKTQIKQKLLHKKLAVSYIEGPNFKSRSRYLLSWSSV